MGLFSDQTNSGAQFETGYMVQSGGEQSGEEGCEDSSDERAGERISEKLVDRASSRSSKVHYEYMSSENSYHEKFIK